MKKSLALTLAILMVIGIAIGGTIAWLTDTSEEVKNTFTTSDVDIELTETCDDEFQMIPGYTYTKDPVVTVKKGSEDAWVFVEVIASEKLGAYIDYAIDDANWTELEGQENIYYTMYTSRDDVDISIKVLQDCKVTVKDTIGKTEMAAAKDNEPTLTFKAYACQYMKNNTQNFTPAEAWGKINPPAGE